MTKCKDCKYFNTLEDICFCNILFQRFIEGKCMSDEIYVINPNGYIGESTKSEIEYAKRKNKKISYLE